MSAPGPGRTLADLFAEQHDEYGTCPNPAAQCPHCREHVCSASGTVDGQAVQPCEGMATVCVFCSMPALFTRNPLGFLVLRAPTEREAAGISNDPGYRQAVERLDRARRAVRFGQDPSRGGLWTPGQPR